MPLYSDLPPAFFMVFLHPKSPKSYQCSTTNLFWSHEPLPPFGQKTCDSPVIRRTRAAVAVTGREPCAAATAVVQVVAAHAVANSQQIPAVPIPKSRLPTEVGFCSKAVGWSKKYVKKMSKKQSWKRNR